MYVLALIETILLPLNLELTFLRFSDLTRVSNLPYLSSFPHSKLEIKLLFEFDSVSLKLRTHV